SLVTGTLHPAAELAVLVGTGAVVYPLLVRLTAPDLFSSGAALLSRARTTTTGRTRAVPTGSPK
ncbi:MAG: hypothetical protein ACR2MR_01210, partial [Dietzia maris]